MKLSSILIGLAALAPASAGGAEYRRYKDASGNIVLSNLPAIDRPAERAPDSLTIVKSYHWPDATPEDIAATAKENLQAARANALSDLTSQVERLAGEIQTSNDIALAELRLQALRPSTEITQISVTTAPSGRSRFRSRY